MSSTVPPKDVTNHQATNPLIKWLPTKQIQKYKRCDKTPYELSHGRNQMLVSSTFLVVLCYILSDRENVGKFDPKADEGIFMGYSLTSKQCIGESIHVNFDDLKTSSLSSDHDELYAWIICPGPNPPQGSFTSPFVQPPSSSSPNLQTTIIPLNHSYPSTSYDPQPPTVISHLPISSPINLQPRIILGRLRRWRSGEWRRFAVTWWWWNIIHRRWIRIAEASIAYVDERQYDKAKVDESDDGEQGEESSYREVDKPDKTFPAAYCYGGLKSVGITVETMVG
ncbi:hypothetical protein OSB04_012569 [Centaurea solstitialis]|uniref:Retroviral polymerase SH3-like domain-containing protein n=1 Tax=Centaurea solstitialis TaxID=347529 RepID=A0AA38TBL1_9ASTR|nr:hypothetical protein OSB04_012569 [Centaurea solstitialis]